MEGYFRIIEGSKSVLEEDLMKARDDWTVRVKLDANPLKSVLLKLTDLLETDSGESQERERKKYKTIPSGPSSETAVLPPTSERPSTPQFNQPRFPSSFETPTDSNKRKASDTSDTSFGTKSTETTPKKLDHPEAKVQSLQNHFVEAIIQNLWWSQVDIPWTRGRRMFLTYSE